MITDLLIKNKKEYANNQSLFGDNLYLDIEKIAKNSCILFIDAIQEQKLDNLPFEWKEYFKTITPIIKNNQYFYDEEATLEQLSEICELRLSPITQEQLQNNGYNGVLPKNQGMIMEDTYKKMLQDITHLIEFLQSDYQLVIYLFMVLEYALKPLLKVVLLESDFKAYFLPFKLPIK